MARPSRYHKEASAIITALQQGTQSVQGLIGRTLTEDGDSTLSRSDTRQSV